MPRLPHLSVLAAALTAAMVLAGCGLLPRPAVTPAPVPAPEVPTELPLPPGQAAAGPEVPPLAWTDFVRDPRLRALVAQALDHNRDLRVAVLGVQRAQAQFLATDAARLPTVGVGVNASRAPNTQGKEANTLTAGVQLASWEIDLFGRLQGLSDAARAQVLASEAGQRAAVLALAAQVLSAGLALQADAELLAVAERTRTSRERTLELTTLREKVGAASMLELQAQRGLVAQAAAAVAQAQRQQAQDRNALALLVGQVPAADALPTAPLNADALADVPVGLPSSVLLRRPDVVQAEQTLAAASANITAARAAFWPSITLTAQTGLASNTLAGLLLSPNFAYTVAGNALATVFDSGRRQANVDSAVASQQVALAQYERAVQAAFRDTADALAGIATWRAQREAQQQQLDAARETARLVDLKARQGAASDLERLDAERTLFANEQALVQLRLAELNNRVALFKALGGAP